MNKLTIQNLFSFNFNRMGFLLLGYIALTIVACKDDTDNPIVEPPAEDPQYVVFYRVETADGRVTYAAIVDDLMTGTIDPSKALEVAGNTRLYAPKDSDYFTIGNSEDFTITRYNVSESGQFIEGDKFSLANEGVTDMQNRMVFLSETKAYYIDYTQGQIVIWNPEKMIITGNITLPEQMKEGYQGNWVVMPFFNFQQNGSKLYIPVGWMNWDDGTYINKTGLAVINTETDQVSNYSEDDRCPFAVNSAILDNGDGYYGVGYYLGWSQQARSQQDCGCILKVKAGEDEFDKDFDPYFMEQIEGYDVSLSLGNAPKRGHGYVRVLDTTKVVWGPDVDGRDYYGLVWLTYEINLEENTVTGQTSLPHSGSYIGSPYDIDGEFYGSIANSDGTNTVIRYTEGGNSYELGLSVPGGLQGLKRVR